ncbi:MAG: DUF6443 domain-containing protein [Chitinophagaceae bacterium]
MKKIGLLFISSFILIAMQAQITAPAAYNSNVKINYIRSWEPVKPYSSESDVISSSRTIQEVRQATAYYDGLGRPLQTVVKKGSMITGDTAKDLVSPLVYDEYNREPYKYLPFVANSTGGNASIRDGKFKLNPFQQDSAFNKGIFTDENYYYNKTIFEVSALNRSKEIYAAGDNWAGTAGQSSESARRGIKTKNWVNVVADSVRIWNVTDVTSDFGTYSTSAIYGQGKLTKAVMQDEHNNQVIEFKDTEGKIILKKVQLTASADTGTGKNHSGWLCTYYIYDDLNQLRAVVQPVGVETLAGNGWTLNSTLLNEQCFRYEYDLKGRVIMKKVPGAGSVWLVYDLRNRPVLTQDSIQRAAGKWMYIIYDGMNRPVSTGFWTNGNLRSYHAERADTSYAYPNLSGQTIEVLNKTFYDDYSWRSGESNPLSDTRSSTYDSYLLSASNSTWPYPQDATASSNRLRGMVTGTKTKVLGTSTYLYSVSFYDEKGRVIQAQATNVSGGTDIATTQYSWTGQALLAIAKQEKSGTNSQTTIAVTKLTYDSLFRVTKTEKKISSTKISSGAMPGSWTTMSETEYDALGQLKKKKLGNAPLETLNYEYNIRGWMLGMNRSFVKDTTSTANWFGFDLGYDKTSFTVNGTSLSYASAQYNGNINGMLWRSTGDDYLRKYDFTYDAANRFLSADFNQLNSNSFNKGAKIDFSVSGMSYDANGNILTINQKGWKLGGSVTIDSLLYGYNTNSNKLNYVNDRANDTASLLGDFKEWTNNTSQDYDYDANGSLTSDANKKISLIHYNHLNLPDSIRVTGKGYIIYTYDASGMKLKKVTRDSTGASVTTTTTLYLGATNFINDTLQYIVTEEGRARIKDSTLMVYDYMIKDHLGNVRMMLTNETRTDAYPAASMEVADSTVEQALYDNVAITRVDNPATYPEPAHGEKIAKVRGSTQLGPDPRLELGPGKLLRVMAGDTLNMQVYSWWSDKNPPSSGFSLSITGLLSSVIAGNGAIQQNPHYESGLASNSDFTGGVSSFLSSQSSYNTSNPKAFINWIAFDDRFNYIAASSGFEQVGNSDDLTHHVISNIVTKKNGYVYIYVSNQTTNIDVFFDNLQVTHVRGPLVQDQAYSPWGLELNGISATALGFGNPVSQKQKYNGKEEQKNEFSDGAGLDWLDYGARMYDAQLGRFFVQDFFAFEYDILSPYQYTSNNPINYIDINGDYILISGTETTTDASGKSVAAQVSVIYEDGKVYNAIQKGGKIVKGEEHTLQSGSFIANAVADLDKIRGFDVGNSMITDLQNMEAGLTIKNNLFYSSGTEYDGTTNSIAYDRRGFDVDGVLAHDFVTLGHEIAHAWAKNMRLGGQYKGRFWNVKRLEYFAVRFENYLRAMSGETVMRMKYTENVLGHSKYFKSSSPENFKNFEIPYRTGELWTERIQSLNPQRPGFSSMDASYHRLNVAVTHDVRKNKITTTIHH